MARFTTLFLLAFAFGCSNPTAPKVEYKEAVSCFQAFELRNVPLLCVPFE